MQFSPCLYNLTNMATFTTTHHLDYIVLYYFICVFIVNVCLQYFPVF